MSTAVTKLAATILFFLFSGSGLAQTENPYIGTWDIDKSNSDFGGAPVPQTMSRTYAIQAGPISLRDAKPLDAMN